MTKKNVIYNVVLAFRQFVQLSVRRLRQSNVKARTDVLTDADAICGWYNVLLSNFDQKKEVNRPAHI